MHKAIASGVVLVGLCASLAAGAPSAAGAPALYTVPGKRVFPAGIAVVPGTRSFYVSSRRDGTIFRGDLRRPAMRPFLAGGANGRESAVGLAADRDRRLFVAGGPTGTLFVYSTRSARLIRAFDTRLRAPASFVADVALAPGGDAYATDSLRPVIYRVPVSTLRPSLDRSPPEPFLDLADSPIDYGPGQNLSGIAVTPDGAALLVVQSNTGALFRIDIASRQITEVPVDGGRTLLGAEGIVLRGGTLYVARGGVRRVAAVELAPDLSSGLPLGTIRARSFADPSALAGTGGRLLVVNSQLDGRLATPPRRARPPFTVSSVRRRP